MHMLYIIQDEHQSQEAAAVNQHEIDNGYEVPEEVCRSESWMYFY